MTTSASVWSIARALEDAVAVDQLGWRLSLTAFRTLRAGGVIVLLCATATGAAIATEWLRDAAGPAGGAAAGAAATGAGAYLVMVHALREVFTARRRALTAHPHAAFHRALDLPRAPVVVAGSLPRLIALCAVALGICLGTAAVLARGGILPLDVATLVAVPAVVTIAAAAITLSVAAWGVGPHRARPLAAMIAGPALGTVAGAAAGGLAGGLVRVASGDVGDLAIALPPWSLAAVGAVAATAVVAALTAIRRLHREQPALPHRGDDVAAAGPAVPSWTRSLLSELAPPERSTPLLRLTSLVWALSAAACAVIPSLLAARLPLPPTGIVDRVAAILAFVLGITAGELLTRWIGPVAVAARARWAWEAGRSAARLAAAPLAIGMLTALLCSVPIGAATTLAGGSPSVPIAVVGVIVASGYFASAVVASDRIGADGAATGSLAAGLITVVISTGAVAVLLGLSSAGLSALGVPLSIAAGGGALWSLRERILRLPSSSSV